MSSGDSEDHRSDRGCPIGAGKSAGVWSVYQAAAGVGRPIERSGDAPKR